MLLAIFIFNYTRALHLHKKIIDQTVAVKQLQPLTRQRLFEVNLFAAWVICYPCRLAINRVFVVCIWCGSHFKHRNIIAGKLHIAFTIFSGELMQCKGFASFC